MDLGILHLVPTASTSSVAEVVKNVGGGANQSINDYLLQSNMFIAAGAIWLLLQILKKLPGFKKLMKNQWVVRFLPLYPLVMATIFIHLPGAVALPDNQIGTKIIGVIWLTALSTFAYKFLGQTVAGDDPRIRSMAVQSPGQYDAVMPPMLPPEEEEIEDEKGDN